MKHTNSNRSNPRSWPIKLLTASVIIGLTGTLASTANARKPIGDLEIYTPAKEGTASIFMMLDTSGSMRGTSGCDGSSTYRVGINLKVYQRKLDADENIVLDKAATPVKDQFYEFIGCKNRAGDIMGRTLLDRLKVAIVELLADEVYDRDGNLKATGSLPDDYGIGIGEYPIDNYKGIVLTPTKELTAQHRADLIDTAQSLSAGGVTPTAHALAESGAYMMGTTTYSYGDRNYSGFSKSIDTAKKADKKTYESPLNDKECSGNGIYILTDGSPNNTNATSSKSIMNRSLSGPTSPLSVNGCNTLQGRGWECTAEYAALLRNPASNTKGLPIKTATVGYGRVFAGLTGKRSIIINGVSKEVVDCDSGTYVNQNTRNLCKLGERKGDNEVKTFGDGGFYYTENSEEIANSIVDFASSLVQTINTAPSGTITVPEDPYRAANQLAYAYLPMLDPDVRSAAAIWRGNLKKYNLDQGTLFGNSDKKLYKDVVDNVSSNIEETTQDLWQTKDFIVTDPKTNTTKIANNSVSAGGVYAQLQAPSDGLGSVRTVYVEDITSPSDSTPVLRKVGVNSTGNTTGFKELKDPVAYSQLNQRRLLSFLGFESVLTADGQPTSNDLVEDLVLTKPTKETKVLGGVVHSAPEAISYGSKLNDQGDIIDPREDYALFGSMDGALHMVDADDGKEAVAIIPRAMMLLQPTALVNGATKSDIGQPYFGVDAPWLVQTDYNYDLDNDKVTASSMMAYGGLRMGGEAFYGMDITDRTAPKALFTITPQGLSSATNGKSIATGFERLGQTWSKPVAAKIRLVKGSSPINNTAPTDVLIFGGGYDMGYEDDSYVPTKTAPARGNAIYMINAQTGELIWSASKSGSTTNNADMFHSITGGITVLDRDNDGLMDHLYAADLGGQVFRADFENARIKQFGFDAVDAFSNKGVTRILNVAPTDKKFAYRFYEAPIVSFFRRESGPDNGKLFAMVNVISGNRSAPLSALRNDNDYANRVYGIIDNDVTSKDLYKSGFTKKVKDLTDAKLVNLGGTLSAIAQASDATRKAEKEKAIAAMIGKAKDSTTAAIEATKNGWYYPLTRFDGYTNVRYNKGVGPSVVINSLLYTTVYNPDKVYGNTPACAAKISGGSERQIYCLPYGVCMEKTSLSGTGGFVPAGQGIQELTLGAYNDKNTDIKVLIGTKTITDRILETNRAKYGADSVKDESNIKDLYSGEGNSATQDNGDGSAVEYLFNERYTLQPKAWYERKQ